MKLGRLAGWTALLLPCVLAVACSDGEKESAARAPILSQTVARIAADALSETPSAEFAAARGRVNSRLDDAQRARARGTALAPGSGGALVLDLDIQRARRAAAVALGTTLDPVRESDVASAEVGLAALLTEVKRLSGAAATCGALPGAKVDDCAIALLIIEVLRSEVVSAGASDGGVDAALPDAATPGPVRAFACGSRDSAGATIATGTLAGPLTWSGTVLVRGDVYVYPGTLTIAPGTRVLMEVDSNLHIGWNANLATVTAEGTEAAPITFCGTRGDPGHWEAVTLGTNVTSDSVLRNVLFADGSGEEAALVLQSDVLIDNVQVQNAENEGVQASDFKAGSRLLSVQGAGKPPVALTAAAAATNFPVGGSFVGNAENVARVRFTSIEADTVLHNLGIPYQQEQDVYHYNHKLTIEAGVEYRVQPDGTLHVGWNAGASELHVNGTAAAPVLFRGVLETPGSWRGLAIGTAVASNSNITYAAVRHAGGGTLPAIDVRSALLVDHLTLADNVLGMSIGDKGLAAGSTTLTISKTRGRPIKVHPNAVDSLPAGGTFTGNDIDQIEVDTASGLTTASTFKKLGVPYYLPGSLNTTGPTLTLAPGTEFVMAADTNVEVGWNGAPGVLTAIGSASEPIRFRGADARPGYWRGIEVDSAISSASQLGYLVIENAGGFEGGALELRAPLPVNNSRFVSSAGYAIRRPSGTAFDYSATNTFEGVALGPIGEL